MEYTTLGWLVLAGGWLAVAGFEIGLGDRLTGGCLLG